MTVGIIINIEGGDGSGKGTQAKLLSERLTKEGATIAPFSFPRYYESRSGKLIGELLAGKHGDFMSMPPYVSALPYAMDRAGAASDIRQALESGKIVVCDRYTPSNMAHQSAKLPRDEQDALAEFIEQLEHEDLGIPKPDVVIYLSVPTDIASELVAKKMERGYLGKTGEGRDQAERNLPHQDRARAAYTRLAKERGWYVIECTHAGCMRSPEDIHTEIWTIVQAALAR